MRRTAQGALLLGVVASLLALLLLSSWRRARSSEAAPAASSGARLVALSPAMTETLYALGAGPAVVGVPDYYDAPAPAQRLPRIGTSLTPDYERIAAARPTLIVTELMEARVGRELEQLAPVLALPWLSLEDVTRGVLALGERTARRDEARALAQRFTTELRSTSTTSSPRVLLVLRDAPGPPSEIYYVKERSLHGAALAAAGYRNAAASLSQGLPKLSVEGALALDPDYVVALESAGSAEAPAARARFVRDWAGLSALRAVQEGHVGAVLSPHVSSVGPRLLELPGLLRAELERLAASAPAPASP